MDYIFKIDLFKVDRCVVFHFYEYFMKMIIIDFPFKYYKTILGKECY